MLNHQMPPCPFDINYEHWIRNRHFCFFKSSDDIERYQRKRRRQIARIHRVDPSNFPIIQSIPKKRTKHPFIDLIRSGTTGSRSKDRFYSYSTPQQYLIEEHSIWRIEKEYEMEKPGIVVFIAISSFPNLMIQKPAPPLNDNKNVSIYGPVSKISVGSQNKCYLFLYNENTTREQWKFNTEEIKSLDPKFIRCSASTLETLMYFCDTKFSCPVISSEETLRDSVRHAAEDRFSHVIDKMFCWDGGFAWYECKSHRKHVLDECCILEEIDGDLISTDLNNMSMPFFRYKNWDQGKIGQGLCECGVYGTFLKEFYGKTIENIIIPGNPDRVVSGRVISEFLTSFFRKGTHYVWNFNDCCDAFKDTKIIYRIHQEIDGTIRFFYCGDKFSEFQRQRTHSVLNFMLYNRREPHLLDIPIIYQDEEQFFHRKQSRSKALFIESDLLKNRCKA